MGGSRPATPAFIDQKTGELLTIIDRAKDVGKTGENGAAFAPQFVENKLKYSAYISEAISFGDARPHVVAAMVAIDFNDRRQVGGNEQQIPYTNYMDLSPQARRSGG